MITVWLIENRYLLKTSLLSKLTARFFSISIVAGDI